MIALKMVPVAVLMLILGTGFAEAQALTDRYGASFHLSLGAQAMELDDLNRRMVANGYPALPSNLLSLGWGTTLRRDRLLILIEGDGLFGPAGATADGRYRTRLVGARTQGSLGYAMPVGTAATVFPSGGVSGGATTLTIQERVAPTFDEVLRRPGRGVQLAAPYLGVNVGGGADFHLAPRPGRTGGTRGLAVTVRGGYSLPLFEGGWMMGEGDEVAAGPPAGIRGPYLRVGIGRWYQGTRRR